MALLIAVVSGRFDQLKKVTSNSGYDVEAHNILTGDRWNLTLVHLTKHVEKQQDAQIDLLNIYQPEASSTSSSTDENRQS